MKLSYAPRGVIQIDDARIVYRNFRGEGSKFNREGDRNFAVIIPDQEIADELIAKGWNVKIKPPRDEDDAPFMYLPVKVKYDEKDLDEEGNPKGPSAYLTSGNNMIKLNFHTISCLDDIDIACVNLDIRPDNWTMPNGSCGTSAYLQVINVIQDVDRFHSTYEEFNRN